MRQTRTLPSGVAEAIGFSSSCRYGRGLTFVPVQSAVVPFDSDVPGGQTNTPPAGSGMAPDAAAGVHPLPSDAASNSATRCFVPRLPNIVIVTQFWLGRGPTA